MNMTCSRRDLNEAVQTVGRAAATQSALPILNHILLAVNEDELQLTATDSELSSRTSIAVVGRLQAPIAVPAKAFGEILLSLPDGDLDLSVGGRHTLLVRQGEIRFELKGLPGGEFPTIPVVHSEGDSAPRVQFDQSTMRRLLRQTSFSVSQDPTRVQYTGILFEGDKEVFRLVSTDGVVRVAISSATLTEPGTPLSAIVPARTVTEFNRILRGDGEGPATIYFRNDAVGPTLASFEANGVMLVSRLIEGQFAPWRRVVPQSWQERATVKCADILSSLRRMAIVARDDQQRVQLSLTPDALQLSCQSPVLGDAEERIPALSEGDEMLIALQGRYLAEGIGALEEEGCRIELTTSLSPCVVRPLEGDNYLYVQSPMHLR